MKVGCKGEDEAGVSHLDGKKGASGRQVGSGFSSTHKLPKVLAANVRLLEDVVDF